MRARKPAMTVRAWLRIRSMIPPLRRRRVPVVLQLSSVECGAACLTMILNYYGRETRLSECRDFCGIGRDGLTARDLASNDCEVLIPVGPAFRLERVSSTDLSLFVLGQAAPAGAPLVHSRCLESVRMMPLTEGDGVRVDLHIRPDALRSIEQSGGRLRLVLSAAANGMRE